MPLRSLPISLALRVTCLQPVELRAENAGEQAKPVEDDENAEEDVEADVAVELEDGLAQDSAKNATRAKDSKAKAKAKTSGKKVPNACRV